jgi:Holliday junction resolvasome RuvABC endonuclease subunit
VTLSLLGLDPGFANLGFAVVEFGPSAGGWGISRWRVVRFGVLRTEASSKKRKVLAVEDNVRRALEIARCLRSLATCCPRTVAICAESMSFPRSSSVAAKVAMSWGAIASLSEAANIPILQASPQQVKHAVCGVKSATKEEVQAAVLAMYPEIEALRAGIAKGLWEHPHDALAVAHLCLQSDVVRLTFAREGGAHV